MSEYPASDHPTETMPTSAARPAGVDQPYAGAYAASAEQASSARPSLAWAPLLPTRVFRGLLVLCLVIGIVAPILMWLELSSNNQTAVKTMGLIFALVGFGLAIISLPLALGEASRLDRTSAGSATGVRAESPRGLTGTRVFALIAVALLFAGSFLLKPVESSAGAGGGGSSQGGGQGRGR